MADNVCRNCKWATWKMTNHAKPRVRKDKDGACNYPLSRIAIPMSVSSAQREVGYLIERNRKPTIWFSSDTQCRVWERVGQ